MKNKKKSEAIEKIKRLSFDGYVKPQRKSYQGHIINILKEYYRIVKDLENLKRQKERGFEVKFPSHISKYGDVSGIRGGNKEYQSSTEEVVIKALVDLPERLDKRIQQYESYVEIIQYILKDKLTEDEETVLEKLYAGSRTRKIEVIAQDLGWSETKFYDLRNSAVDQIAESFGIFDGKFDMIGDEFKE